jgi:hypothetical protein
MMKKREEEKMNDNSEIQIKIHNCQKYRVSVCAAVNVTDALTLTGRRTIPS